MLMTIDKNNKILSSGEKNAKKKMQHILNMAKANPALAAANKASADAKRERRLVSGSKKVINN